MRGQFSNLPQPLSGLLFHSLTGLEDDQDPQEARISNGWPDGRRKFGTVSGAIMRVLTETEIELSVKAIRLEVERLLDAPVSRFSVADYLLIRSKGRKPLFERTRHGHYRLLRS